MIPLFVIIGLFVATLFAFTHAHSKKIAAEDHAASNARVLREFQRISIYSPEKIIDHRKRY